MNESTEDTTSSVLAGGGTGTGEDPLKLATGEEDDSSSGWTTLSVLQTIGVFFLTGAAEILGGWLVWVTVRGQGESNKRKPWWYAVIGSLVLICYGFVPTLQPEGNFGRIYAAYGGFFIIFSFLFGWGVDGVKPDVGDIIGGCIAVAGVCIVMFWPR